MSEQKTPGDIRTLWATNQVVFELEFPERRGIWRRRWEWQEAVDFRMVFDSLEAAQEFAGRLVKTKWTSVVRLTGGHGDVKEKHTAENGDTPLWRVIGREVWGFAPAHFADQQEGE